MDSANTNQSRAVTKSKSSSLAGKLFGIIFTIIILLIITVITLAALHNSKIIDLSFVIDTLMENNLWPDWLDNVFIPREPDGNPELNVIDHTSPSPTPRPPR